MNGRRRGELWRMVADNRDPADDDDWAHGLCLAAVAVLEVDAAAVTLRSTAQTQDLLGISGSWAAKLVDVQYSLGEGPGVEAFRVGAPVLIADLSAEQDRWPMFGTAALATGVGAMFAFPLQVGGIRLGLMELFRRRPGGLPAGKLTDALLLAALAIDAILDDAQAAEREGQDWPHGPGSYQDVNVATGMVAAQLRISLNDAFARLRGHAFAQNRSVLQVARDVLARTISLDELAE